MSFENAYSKTNKLEGGYSNHPSDRGGETWAGISRKHFPGWAGWKIIDSLKTASNFPRNLAGHPLLEQYKKEFYKREFWDKLRLSEIRNEAIAIKLYDIAVNCGVSFSVRILQRTLNVANQKGKYYPDLKVDGVIGPKTIDAVNKHPKPDVIFKCLNVLQGAHYIQITEARESNEDFLNGWFLNRIASVVSQNDSYYA